MIQFKQLKTLVAVVALLWISLTGLAQDIPTQPNPPRMVNDFAHQLNPQEINQLEQKLRGYRDSTSTEIAIVIVANTGESDPYDYAIKLAKTWGVGAKKKNNGVVLLWATETRKVRIVTGRGIEGVLPDAICKRIINRNIIPHFKQQAWFAGLDEGTTEMMRRASGEFKADAVGRGSAQHLPNRFCPFQLTGSVISGLSSAIPIPHMRSYGLASTNRLPSIRNFNADNRISGWQRIL